MAEDEEQPTCPLCGRSDGPYPRGDRPQGTSLGWQIGMQSGCSRCGSCA